MFENENNLLCFALILFTSILSYLFIEKPFRNKSKTSFKQTIIFISIISVIIFVFSIYSLLNKGYEKRFNFNIENYNLDNKFYSDRWTSEKEKYFNSENSENFTKEKINILIVGNSHGQDLFNLFFFKKIYLTNIISNIQPPEVVRIY